MNCLSIRFRKKMMQLCFHILKPVFMPLLKYMAFTGIGSDECLRNGFLPVPLHYYQPIPDLPEIEKRGVFSKESKLRGIQFYPEACIAFLKSLSFPFATECQWPNEPSNNPRQFHLHNGCFSFGCAAPLHCMIRNNKPKRIVEIGSGNSSKVISAAIELNARENHETQYTIIDPYSTLTLENLPKSTRIIRNPVESMEMDVFEALTENDILFVDSSHVCKTGSDVNFEILEILPSLSKGVFVHFHDIPMPFEYPKTYFTNPHFRVFWNESYLLQAFLACNREFQIVLPMSYLQKYYLDDLKSLFPNSLKTSFGWVSGSFWIKRIERFPPTQTS